MQIAKNARLVVRNTFTPNPAFVRMGDHNTSFMTLPGGSEGNILKIDGSDILVALLPFGPGRPRPAGKLLPAVQRMEVWVKISHFDLLFQLV